jgi:hypothetical protein
MIKPRSHKTTKIPMIVYNMIEPPDAMLRIRSFSNPRVLLHPYSNDTQGNSHVSPVVLTCLIKIAQRLAEAVREVSFFTRLARYWKRRLDPGMQIPEFLSLAKPATNEQEIQLFIIRDN